MVLELIPFGVSGSDYCLRSPSVQLTKIYRSERRMGWYLADTTRLRLVYSATRVEADWIVSVKPQLILFSIPCDERGYNLRA